MKKRTKKPPLRRNNIFYFLATGFFTGLSPFFPGTIASLIFLPLWWLMTFLSSGIFLLILLISVISGVYLCDVTERDIGKDDHDSIVWDEFVGMWITLIAVPKISLGWVLMSFFIFRIFDIWKPWPISWLDCHIHGGIGIMLDDIIAGIISAFTIVILAHTYNILFTNNYFFDIHSFI